MRDAIIAYIGLGSNLGDRDANIQKALRAVGDVDGVQVEKASSVIETESLVNDGQEEYLNAAAKLSCSISAEQLLGKLLAIEDALGRTREAKWAARTIDLDLLLYGSEVVDEQGLILPHPQMHLRSFVLRNLIDIDPQICHPVLDADVSQLAERLGGNDFVPASDSPAIISIAGLIGVGKTTLGNKLAELYDCDIVLEPYKENPFLAKVYAGQVELALDSQLFFLTERIKQLNVEKTKQSKICITDYVFQKELVYAEMQLDDIQLDLYKNIYNSMTSGQAQPCVVVYLTDTSQGCLAKIHKRNRPYEQHIEAEFLDELGRKYDELFEKWDICPVIKLEACEIDYSDEQSIGRLAEQIKYYADVSSTSGDFVKA